MYNEHPYDHAETTTAVDAILDDLLLAGGTPEAIQIANERMEALQIDDDEFTEQLVLDLPTAEQRARFRAGLDLYDRRLSLECERQAAQRALLLARFEALRVESRLFALEGIWSVLRQATDLGIDDETIPSLESKVLEWLWFDLESPLYTEGSAKATTRIYRYARAQAMGWKTDRLRRRRRYMPHDVYLKREDELRIAAMPKSAKRPLAETIRIRPEEDVPLAA